VLQLLVDRIGEIVTKEELFESAWKAEYDICADEALKYHIRGDPQETGSTRYGSSNRKGLGVGYRLSLEKNSSGW